MGLKQCYAYHLTERYKGRKGWPESFASPALFTERLEPALKWADLTGKERPSKPWLNGYPRLIFVNDLGDTFTESLPIDWLAPLLPVMAESPHIWLLLTKRGTRMLRFFNEHPVPPNFWLGVSVTTQPTMRRVDFLRQIRGAGGLFISMEPLLGPVDVRGDLGAGGEIEDCAVRSRIGQIILGGESGPMARTMNMDWARAVRDQCRAAKTPFFFKQAGARIGHGGDLLDGRAHKEMPVWK